MCCDGAGVCLCVFVLVIDASEGQVFTQPGDSPPIGGHRVSALHFIVGVRIGHLGLNDAPSKKRRMDLILSQVTLRPE